jgi:hypothetical protein
VAPLIDDFLGNKQTFSTLQQLQQDCEVVNNYYNFVLRCSDGIFEDKFLFMNTTPDGELFGSGNPDELNLTMYIEQAGLSDKHAEIKFVDDCKYMLRDCNSETGTWVRVGHESQVEESLNSGFRGSGIDLMRETRLRMYKAGPYNFVIEDHPVLQFSPLKTWLKANNFQKYF